MLSDVALVIKRILAFLSEITLLYDVDCHFKYIHKLLRMLYRSNRA